MRSIWILAASALLAGALTGCVAFAGAEASPISISAPAPGVIATGKRGRESGSCTGLIRGSARPAAKTARNPDASSGTIGRSAVSDRQEAC